MPTQVQEFNAAGSAVFGYMPDFMQDAEWNPKTNEVLSVRNPNTCEVHKFKPSERNFSGFVAFFKNVFNGV